MFTKDDYKFMAQALYLARKGIFTTDPNPRVGCIIVKNNQVTGKGYHKYAGGDHAEIAALKNCKNNGYDPASSEVYVTLEPCSHFGRTPPCAKALIEAKVSKVTIAATDPNPQVAGRGIKMLQDAGIEVKHGLLEQESRELNRGFIKRMESGKPFVLCKMAMSMDGRTAMASGESKWITSAQSRADVHRIRAASSAMLTGIGTVLHDDPAMTARLQEDTKEILQPQRIILDPQFQIPESAQILKKPTTGIPTETTVITAIENSDKIKRLKKIGAIVKLLSANNTCFDLNEVLCYLAEQQINNIMLESGAQLAGAFLEAGLIDELIIYMAPHIMGNNAKGLFALPTLEKMSQRIDLDIKEIYTIGNDIKITATVINL
ncbi:MAG: bifunctional diaminohydroxyphosphoribosylaminopyrimidine deaminase/5-amino-6-(5-phosphoribosylamino)uracil reductase RibD [Gammaproteobacteria bacterium]|nr:MAG: bifunctional diaminohydroxyphosphoribosylaminopyrimidine deaminase/5-amino-6-(5-phosphoribosylamino)uracil reductase RibD [Gammaproteobacteria bacterium]